MIKINNHFNKTDKNMGGLAKICRMYGGMKFKDNDGNEVMWLWDYKNEKPRLASEMTKEEIKESEKYKLKKIKQQLKKDNNG